MLKCDKYKKKGYVISTGQIFDDDFMGKVMIVADELSKMNKEDLEELMKDEEDEEEGKEDN